MDVVLDAAVVKKVLVEYKPDVDVDKESFTKELVDLKKVVIRGVLWIGGGSSTHPL